MTKRRERGHPSAILYAPGCKARTSAETNRMGQQQESEPEMVRLTLSAMPQPLIRQGVLAVPVLVDLAVLMPVGRPVGRRRLLHRWASRCCAATTMLAGWCARRGTNAAVAAADPAAGPGCDRADAAGARGQRAGPARGAAGDVAGGRPADARGDDRPVAALAALVSVPVAVVLRDRGLLGVPGAPHPAHRGDGRAHGRWHRAGVVPAERRAGGAGPPARGGTERGHRQQGVQRGHRQHRRRRAGRPRPARQLQAGQPASDGVPRPRLPRRSCRQGGAGGCRLRPRPGDPAGARGHAEHPGDARRRSSPTT